MNPGLWLESLLVPPALSLLLILLAGLFRRHWYWAGLGALLLAFATLWAASTPRISYPLIDYLQSQHPPVDPTALPDTDAQAIVVLAAGRRNATPDFGDTISRLTLARVRYAAHLYRATGLPVIATGGAPGRAGGPPAGLLMQEALQTEFGVNAPAAEQRSANTYENARFTRQMLAAEGIERIVLVTQALHMPRAVAAFEAVGFEVIPAPTDYEMPARGRYRWLPSANTMTTTQLALHELIGGVWYRWHYDVPMPMIADES